MVCLLNDINLVFSYARMSDLNLFFKFLICRYSLRVVDWVAIRKAVSKSSINDAKEIE